jgi:hypothetical protein
MAEPNDTPPQNDDPTRDGSSDATAETDLGEAGKKALDRERDARKRADDARKQAEKEARDAKARLKELEDKELSENDRLKREAEAGREAFQTGVKLARDANLKLALTEKGLTGTRARAAMKLLDGVEFDDSSNEPKNLDDAIEAAKTSYGAEMFEGATPPPDPDPDENENGRESRRPNLHQGARREAGPDEEKRYAEAFKHTFGKEPRGVPASS